MLDSMLSASRRICNSARSTSRLSQSIGTPITANSARSGSHRFPLYLTIGMLCIFFVGCGGSGASVSACAELDTAIDSYDAAAAEFDGFDTAVMISATDELQLAAEELRSTLSDDDERTDIGRLSTSLGQLSLGLSEEDESMVRRGVDGVSEYAPVARTICENAS